MFPKLSCKIADRLEYYGIVQKSNKALYISAKIKLSQLREK